MSLADRLAKAQQKDRLAEVRLRVQERLVEVLGPRLYDSTLSDNELEGLVHQRLRELLDEEEGPLSAQEKLLIVRQIGDSVLGLGPLEPYIRDSEVSEIMVNNWDSIYVERAGKLHWTGTKFHDEQQLRRTIDKIVGKVGRRVDEASPYVDARLPDGSRVNAVVPPLAIDGPALTIRKFSADPYQAENLVEFGTLTSAIAHRHAVVPDPRSRSGAIGTVRPPKPCRRRSGSAGTPTSRDQRDPRSLASSLSCAARGVGGWCDSRLVAWWWLVGGWVRCGGDECGASQFAGGWWSW